MNIKQMKRAVSTFRTADVSIIKDDTTRAKAQKLQAKQKGFTLLELLVVITLLATLATAALVAYDGIGENSSDTAAANNLLSAESALRNYRAVENAYPNQWDNLANLDGVTTDASGAMKVISTQTKGFFGQWAPAVPTAAELTAANSPTNPVDTVTTKVAKALEAVGITDFQTLPSNAPNLTDAVPNLVFNESGGSTASEFALWNEDTEQVEALFDGTPITTGNIALSIVPSNGLDAVGVSHGCSAAGVNINQTFAGLTLPDSSNLNLINDAVANDSCTLIIAAGYGKDVPGTTIDSRVAIAQVPTVGTPNINPANNYARAIALFQVGEDGSDGSTPDGTISVDEVFSKARLIGVVDPEGRAIDTVLAAANATN